MNWHTMRNKQWLSDSPARSRISGQLHCNRACLAYTPVTVSMTSRVTTGLSLLSLTYFTISAFVFGKFILPSKTPFTMSLAVAVLFAWCSPAGCWLSPSRSSKVLPQTLQTNLVVRPPLATGASFTSATSCFSGVIRGLFSLGRSKFVEELPQTCRLQPCAFTCVSLSLRLLALFPRRIFLLGSAMQNKEQPNMQ